MYGILKIGDEKYQIVRATNLLYEVLASEWNELSPEHKTFKKDERLYFCKLVEEATIEEESKDLENPII